MQSLNSQSLPQQDDPKPKRHNAKLCPFAIRQRIIHALANGDSIRSIARTFHVSNNTVAAIHDKDRQQVEALQQRIAAQCRQIATKALDRINDRLDQPKPISMRELVPIAGVAIDKIVLLDRGAKLPDLHQHLHEHLHITPEQIEDAVRELRDSPVNSVDVTASPETQPGSSR